MIKCCYYARGAFLLFLVQPPIIYPRGAGGGGGGGDLALVYNFHHHRFLRTRALNFSTKIATTTAAAVFRCR